MSEVFIRRIKKFDSFISRLATGTPEELAQKMHISKRCVHKYISIMKKSGAPIKYCRKSKTYMYYQTGRFQVGFYGTEDA